ncbi:MAG: Gfo/Idh/MocA family oxidoreductase [Pontiella sp.]
MKRLKLAAIGCGNRARIYTSLASQQPDLYEIVAAADPNEVRLNYVKNVSNNPDFKSFSSDKELLAEELLADVLIIGTQDNYHYEPCKAALLKGYDVLLEKPIAPCVEEILELQELAEQLGRKLQVCYVLRYTPFYRKVKEIVDSGILGEIITVNANEGVLPWHQAHSFVRGNWSQSGKSSPMIVAKCSHDTDIISWLIGKECLSISSFGSLKHFRASEAPEGAPARCTDDCPHLETCHYNARKYAGEHRTPWLAQVFDRAVEASDEEIIEWLRESDFGRCVYHSDNDVVDHQVVSMNFEGDVTANLTMTAFEVGRSIELFGTKGYLKGGYFMRVKTGNDIHVQLFDGNEQQHSVDVDEEDHHMGGDDGIMNALYEEMAGDKSVPVSSYIQSHIMGYAAEKSRLTGQVVHLEEYRESFRK